MTSSESPGTTPLAPYESQLVCEFFRQAGRIERARDYEKHLRARAAALVAAIVSKRIDAETRKEAMMDLQALVTQRQLSCDDDNSTLVGNAQNPLDHLVGDVMGQTEAGRYFIVEFKRYADGFLDEVALAYGKPDRMALYSHLLVDDDCRDLSGRGHFGAYFKAGSIAVGGYFDLAGANLGQVVALSSFFDGMQNAAFAWSKEELAAYLECMTAHGVPLITDDGHVVFGYLDPTGKFVATTGTTKLLAMIQETFKRAQAMHQVQNAQRVQASRPAPEHRPSSKG